LSGLNLSVYGTTSKSSFDPEIRPDLQQTKSVLLFEYPTQQTEAVPGLATVLWLARKSASQADSNSLFVNPPEEPVLSALAICPAHLFSKLSPTGERPMTLKRSPL
jgi:hypothetical protein